MKSKNREIDYLIERLGMKPLPGEGGYYTETYRCRLELDEACLPEGFNGSRNLNTAILYLITQDSYSHLHRIKSDEVFHFYKGDPVYMLNLYPDGSGREIILGSDIQAGQSVQYTVPAGCWQGACLDSEGKYALLGTTVSPGFDFNDYGDCRGKSAEIIKKYPQYRKSIERLV